MSKLNGKGPENKGSGTGRRLGKCSGKVNALDKINLGQGLGKRKNAGNTEIIKHK